MEEETPSYQNPPLIPPRSVPPLYENFNQTSEILARLLMYNPAILSMFFGIGTHAFCDQFFKLWPEARQKLVPFLTVPTLLTASVGWKIGYESVRNPQQDLKSRLVNRIFFSSAEGIGGVFPFLLGEIIQAYCKNPKHLNSEGACMVSDEAFWLEFFTFPAGISALYITYTMVPPSKKFIFASKGKGHKLFISIADVLSRTLFYSRLVQASLANIHAIPKPTTYEAAAIVASVLVLSCQILKPQYWQKLDALMMLAMIANLSTYMWFFLKSESSHSHWSFLTKLCILPIFFVAGIVLTIPHLKQYLKERSALNRVTLSRGHPLPFQEELCRTLEDDQKRPQVIKGLLDKSWVKKTLSAQLSGSPLSENLSPLAAPLAHPIKEPHDQSSMSLDELLETDPQYSMLKNIITNHLLNELGFKVAWEIPEEQEHSEQYSIISRISLRDLLQHPSYSSVTHQILKELDLLNNLNEAPSPSSTTHRRLEMRAGPSTFIVSHQAEERAVLFTQVDSNVAPSRRLYSRSTNSLGEDMWPETSFLSSRLRRLFR